MHPTIKAPSTHVGSRVDGEIVGISVGSNVGSSVGDKVGSFCRQQQVKSHMIWDKKQEDILCI